MLAFDGRIRNNKLLKLERGSFGAIRRRYRGGFELETLNTWMDFEGAIFDGDRSGDGDVFLFVCFIRVGLSIDSDLSC